VPGRGGYPTRNIAVVDTPRKEETIILQVTDGFCSREKGKGGTINDKGKKAAGGSTCPLRRILIMKEHRGG